jgi:hypothetical protein
LTIGEHTADPERIQVTEMIGVKVPNEHFVEVVRGNLHRGKSIRRGGPDVEDELVFCLGKEMQPAKAYRSHPPEHLRASSRNAHVVVTPLSCFGARRENPKRDVETPVGS